MGEHPLRAYEDAFRVGHPRYTYDISDPLSAFLESIAKSICTRYIFTFDDKQETRHRYNIKKNAEVFSLPNILPRLLQKQLFLQPFRRDGGYLYYFPFYYLLFIRLVGRSRPFTSSTHIAILMHQLRALQNLGHDALRLKFRQRLLLVEHIIL